MKSNFKVAIVGRPNVGKSALFNRIVRRRKSIVENVSGVTRDRVYGDVDVFGKQVEFIDTGGIDREDSILLSREIRIQAEKAIAEADLLVLVVDSQVGATLYDEEVARYCLKQKKEVLLAVNKVDHRTLEERTHAFHSLGIEQVFPVSAAHGYGLADLLEVIHQRVPEKEEEEEIIEEPPKIAIIGRPNVGKSTIFNAILKENRQVVSELAGTTRDAIDAVVDNLIFIDTAGLKKKKAEKESVEKFATIRTHNAISRCDVCLFVIDAYQGLTSEEKKILTMIEEEGKACILFLNKWDTVEKVTMEEMKRKLRSYASFLNYVPVIIGSGKTNRNIDKIIPTIHQVYEHFCSRISTGKLNSLLEKAVQQNHPPMITGKRLRIYYLTQIKTKAPCFALFVNYTKLLSESYRRYLVAQLRKSYPFTGCPIQFKVLARPRKERFSSKNSAALA